MWWLSLENVMWKWFLVTHSSLEVMWLKDDPDVWLPYFWFPISLAVFSNNSQCLWPVTELQLSLLLLAPLFGNGVLKDSCLISDLCDDTGHRHLTDNPPGSVKTQPAKWPTVFTQGCKQRAKYAAFWRSRVLNNYILSCKPSTLESGLKKKRSENGYNNNL